MFAANNYSSTPLKIIQKSIFFHLNINKSHGFIRNEQIYKV